MSDQTATSGAAPDDSFPPAPSGSEGSPGAGSRGGQTQSRAAGIARQVMSRYGLVIAFLVMIAVFSLLKPHVFPTGDNAKAILEETAPPAILAIGLTAVLVMNDFDLSFGAMLGVGSGLVSVLLVNHHMAWPLAVIICLLVGIAGGVLTGVLVAVLGGSSFIITLAMGTVLTGVEYAITKQKDIFSGMPASFTDIAQGSSILGINNQVWIALGIGIIVWLLLEKTEIGRFMYAIGGNTEAARLAGVRVRTLRILGFVLIGMAAIIAGILITSLGGAYTPNPGPSYLLPAYAGCFLGAAAFKPGQFNVPGTIIGVLFLESIQTGLTMLNLSTWIINVVQGVILIVAVLLSRLGEKAA